MDKVLKNIISASRFEAAAAVRMHADDLNRPLCVEIGGAEVARYGGLHSAIAQCSHDVLTDLVLAAIWERVPSSRALVSQIDAMLAERNVSSGAA